MHDACFQMMKHFVVHYALPAHMKGFVPADKSNRTRLSVADVGAYDVNGTFKELFSPGCFEYTGLDVQAGPNVDRVVEPYNFGETLYDIVISGNTLEHVEDMYSWQKAFVEICKPGGLICITVPHSFPEHKFPIDCWRIFPDGVKWLFRNELLLECQNGATDTMFIGQRRS